MFSYDVIMDARAAGPSGTPEQYKIPPNPAREAVLNQIGDSDTRRIMVIGVYPMIGQLRPYSDRSDAWKLPEFATWISWNPEEQFIHVLEKQAGANRQGQFFKDVFALAASADSPVVLQNALGSLEAVSPLSFSISRKINGLEIQRMIDSAQDAFLQTTITPSKVNPRVEAITKQIVQRWGGSRRTGLSNDPTYLYHVFRDIFYGQSGLSRPVPNENGQFFAETFFNMVLNQSVPLELRKLTFSAIPFGFGFGSSSPDGKQVNPLFGQNASFWRDVDVSWIFPHMAHFRKSAAGPSLAQIDPASLAKGYDDLHQRASDIAAQLDRTESDLANALAENARLNEQLGDLLMRAGGGEFREEGQAINPAMLEAALYYKEFGGHPLSVLGIGLGVWRNYTSDQRDQALKQAYRQQARQWHYDIPRQDTRYNEMAARATGEKFTQITRAFAYLGKNLNRAEFPDLPKSR